MANYINVADFRTATLAEYCTDIPLTAVESPDALLSGTIARMCERFDAFTNDHYLSESENNYPLSANASKYLTFPRRVNKLYNLYTVDFNGVSTWQQPTAYRFISSLDPDGARRVYEQDSIEVIAMGPGLAKTLWPWTFDEGSNTVLVDADFGWVLCPYSVKRAVALMTYDHVKPLRGDLRRVSRYNTADTQVDLALTTPTGIPEVDDTILEYQRETLLSVG